MLLQQHAGKQTLPDYFDSEKIKFSNSDQIYSKIVFQLFFKTKLEPEILLCSVVFAQRLLEQFTITRHNVTGFFTACIMIQSKVNDDRGMKLPSFARQLCVDVKKLAQMEEFLCKAVEYHLFVRGSDYREIYKNIIV